MADIEIGTSGTNASESETISLKDNSFNPRLGFIRKVYGIITTQLLVTIGISYLAMLTSESGFGAFVRTNLPAFWVAVSINLITMILVFCCRKLASKVPANYFMLSLFTLSEAYMVSSVCAAYQEAGMARLVIMAAVMTAAMTFALTLYACTTKTDVTMYGGILFILGCAIFLFSIFEFFTGNPTLHILVSVLAVIVYGFYLIYDTQLIMGGGTYELGLDDYIIAAIIIYIDIIVLFIRILQILTELLGKQD